MEDIAERLQELSLSWYKLGNTNYRLNKMHPLQWTKTIFQTENFDMEDMLIACSRNGGPIAVAKKPGRLIYGNDSLLKEHIGIFNGCGVLIAKPNVIHPLTLVEQHL